MRLPERPATTAWSRIARIAPFAVVGSLSLIAAARAPQGRKPFQMDLTISIDDLARSMTKVPHLRSIAVLFLLAVVAFGAHRLARAFWSTTLLGIGWELAQTTVVGHNARLADLAPNLTAALLCLALIAGIRWLRLRQPRTR